MVLQTLVIGKRKFVVVPEREFHRLRKKAGEEVVRPEIVRDALRELRAYRRTGKAIEWSVLKRKLGL